jgi:hypothetical protein
VAGIRLTQSDASEWLIGGPRGLRERAHDGSGHEPEECEPVGSALHGSRSDPATLTPSHDPDVLWIDVASVGEHLCGADRVVGQSGVVTAEDRIPVHALVVDDRGDTRRCQRPGFAQQRITVSRPGAVHQDDARDRSVGRAGCRPDDPGPDRTACIGGDSGRNLFDSERRQGAGGNFLLGIERGFRWRRLPTRGALCRCRQQRNACPDEHEGGADEAPDNLHGLVVPPAVGDP